MSKSQFTLLMKLLKVCLIVSVQNEVYFNTIIWEKSAFNFSSLRIRYIKYFVLLLLKKMSMKKQTASLLNILNTSGFKWTVNKYYGWYNIKLWCVIYVSCLLLFLANYAYTRTEAWNSHKCKIFHSLSLS